MLLLGACPAAHFFLLFFALSAAASCKEPKPFNRTHTHTNTETKRTNKVNTHTAAVQCKLMVSPEEQSEAGRARGEREALAGKAIDRPLAKQQFAPRICPKRLVATRELGKDIVLAFQF